MSVDPAFHAWVKREEQLQAAREALGIKGESVLPAIVPIWLTKNVFNELYMSEHDTCDVESPPLHHEVADQLAAATKDGDYYKINLTPRTIGYLIENLHYHVDRNNDWVSETRGHEHMVAMAVQRGFVALDKRLRQLIEDTARKKETPMASKRRVYWVKLSLRELEALNSAAALGLAGEWSTDDWGDLTQMDLEGAQKQLIEIRGDDRLAPIAETPVPAPEPEPTPAPEPAPTPTPA